jgi:hypothetical protein
MIRLLLSPEGCLLRKADAWQDADDGVDVAENALEYLFESVAFDPGLRVKDFFMLFEHCPDLVPIYRRFYSEELCATAALGPFSGESPTGLDYLELRQTWEQDSLTQTYDIGRFDLSGLGKPVEGDLYTMPEANGLVRYSLIGVDLRAILSLPLLFTTEVRVFESNPGAANAYRQIGSVNCPDPKLGEVLQAVFWSLTWLGGQEETSNTLQRLLEQGQSGAWEEFSADDLSGDEEPDGVRKPSCHRQARYHH